MNFDFGAVFGEAFAIFRQRFWPMLGLWATFIGLLFALFVGFFIFAGASILGLSATVGLDSAAQETGLLEGVGIGLLASFFVLYVAMFVLILAQQGAICAKASPVVEVTFGEAVARGLRTGVTLTALMIPLIMVQFALALVATSLTGATGSAGPVLGAILAFLMLPAGVYLACRLAVLVPVIAVERVLNPFKAVRRAWSITRGKALAILVVLVLGGALAFALFGLPALLVGALDDGASPLVAVVPLLMFPALIAYTLFVACLGASLHAALSDYGAQNAAEIFE